MNAVRTFREIMQDPQRVENIDLKEFLNSGTISAKLKNLTEQEKEDLSHLRMNLTNGVMFDDRGKEIIATLP